MLLLKDDSPEELVQRIEALEARADECYHLLSLLRFPRRVARWGALTASVLIIEAELRKWGSNSPMFFNAIQNLSLRVPVVLKWVNEHGNSDADETDLMWTADLASSALNALDIAGQYSHFLYSFPLWHKNRYFADLLGDSVVRFSATFGRSRQVSAYAKGLRPSKGHYTRVTPQNQSEAPLSIRNLFSDALASAQKVAANAFTYRDPWPLWESLLPRQLGRLSEISRRPESFNLGGYTIADLRIVYAGLLAICETHEFLCAEWGNINGQYPAASAVMVRTDWVDILCRLSRVDSSTCNAIMEDLTFRLSDSVSLQVNPFLPVGNSTELAIAHPFPLLSNFEESALRVFSYRRKPAFEALSDAKEQETIDTVKGKLAGRSVEGPISMPKTKKKTIPDIDLLLVDEGDSTLVLCELKWVRKSLLPKEIPGKDADVLKGFTQLREIRNYLGDHPDHLRDRKMLQRSIADYHVYYLVVARDHFPWREPEEGIAIVDFQACFRTLSEQGNLRVLIDQLLRYEWLPVEDRDFRIAHDRATVNGVSVEGEIFLPIH